VAVLVAVVVSLFYFRPPDGFSIIHKKEFVSRQNIHAIERQLVVHHREKASAIMVCLVMTTGKNISLDRTVRILDHAYIPANVAVHLAVVSSSPVAIRKDAWHRGNCTVFKNISLLRFRKGLCFIVVQDTVDIGPYFVYWMWRAWLGAEERGPSFLVSGDPNGTSGVIPHHAVWVNFVRSERALGNADAMRRYFDYARRTVVDVSLLHPPVIDGYAVARAVRQSMVEPEREPRLIRVWDERFVTQAVLVLK